MGKMNREGLCQYPGCDIWGDPYCPTHRDCNVTVKYPAWHQPSHKPTFPDPPQVSGKRRHNRPDGTPIAKLSDGSFDPGPNTITKEEYYRRLGA